MNEIKRGDGVILGGRFGAVVFVNEARGLVSCVMFPPTGSSRYDVWSVQHQVAAMGIVLGDLEVKVEEACPVEGLAPWTRPDGCTA